MEETHFLNRQVHDGFDDIILKCVWLRIFDHLYIFMLWSKLYSFLQSQLILPLYFSKSQESFLEPLFLRQRWFKVAYLKALKSISKFNFEKCFENWKKLWQKSIISNKDYYRSNKILQMCKYFFQKMKISVTRMWNIICKSDNSPFVSNTYILSFATK